MTSVGMIIWVSVSVEMATLAVSWAVVVGTGLGVDMTTGRVEVDSFSTELVDSDAAAEEDDDDWVEVADSLLVASLVEVGMIGGGAVPVPPTMEDGGKTPDGTVRVEEESGAKVEEVTKVPL